MLRWRSAVLPAALALLVAPGAPAQPAAPAQAAAPPAPSWYAPGTAPPATPSVAPAPTPAPTPDVASARADHQAGLLRLQAGELGEAIDLFKAAAAKDPDSALIANDLGFALGRLGARREAEAQYRRALALDPRGWLAFANLAELVAQSPDRWQRRVEVMALLERGQAAARDDERGRRMLALATARFEQSVGLLSEARLRIEVLLREELPSSVRRQALDQLGGVAEDERALALADWPEPALPAAAQTSLRAAEEDLANQRAAVALKAATDLVDAHPSSAGPRFVRARALEALGRPDEASRELTMLLQLRPSHAEAWRLLGELLTRHGGLMQAERADEALRRALALEPSWNDLRELRRGLGLRRTEMDRAPPVPQRQLPSRRAHTLYEEAQRLMGSETPELARAALAEALTEAPGFVDAAVSLFALTSQVPPATVTALWNDGEGLTRLATEILRIRQEEDTARLVRGWLDRAVVLGVAEARFQRALLRAQADDAEGALADLSAYTASDVNPPHLAEARALRRTLEPAPAGRDADLALARQLLLADRPREAARTLGGSCRNGLSASTLVELGRIAEYELRTDEAVTCHRLALATAAPPEQRAPLERIARIAAHAPMAALRALASELERARAAGIPAASWALARLAHDDEHWEAATRLADDFLGMVPARDPLRADALRAVGGWRARSDEQRRERSRRLRLGALGGGLAGVLALALLLGRRLRGRSVTGALGRVPDLYPDVAVAVAAIRHDVLKHRASALGMIGSSVTAREEIARALREPTATSALVTGIYERLKRAAAAAGVTLRPLHREPLFGPVARALARAEALVDRVGNGAELLQIDRLLREQLGPALAGLLALVPRTRLDPAQMAGWLRGVTDAATPGPAGGLLDFPDAPPITPGLHLPALDLEVPLPREALHTILANLVRNAVGALRHAPEPRVLLRVEQQRDAAGRRLVTFLVADSAAEVVSLDQIEQRDGQRGLGIVRDLVRRWGGHLVVQREAAPFVKAIGAAFPVVPSPASSP
jgi:tetratricopeptide (TPR) repeat protein